MMFFIERHVVVPDARIAQEIPGAVEERVRHVRLAALHISLARDTSPCTTLVTRSGDTPNRLA